MGADSIIVYKDGSVKQLHRCNHSSIITGKRTWTHRKYHHDISAKPFHGETENLALVMKKTAIIPLRSLLIA